MFAFDPKSFATGCQNVDLRCRTDYARRQRRYRFDKMLTRIEDQENSLVAQVCDQMGIASFD